MGIRSLIFPCMLKQPSIPRQRVLIKLHLAGWKAEIQKGWVTGDGHPESRGYRSEYTLAQSDCGRKRLSPPPSAHIVTTHLATSHIPTHDFQLMKYPHHRVSSQQRCPFLYSVPPKATVSPQTITFIELKLIFQNVRLPMLSTWVETKIC